MRMSPIALHVAILAAQLPCESVEGFEPMTLLHRGLASGSGWASLCLASGSAPGAAAPWAGGWNEAFHLSCLCRWKEVPCGF
jgi:hypothetical protein